nr:probable LRR receptor-like serine/threonine-protein kinase At1g56140 [Quercus suber]
MNVVIDEASESGFEKISEEIPKEILPLEPKDVNEIFYQEPTTPSTLGTPSVAEGSIDIPTSPDSKSHEEEGPSSRIKLNHPPKFVVEVALKDECWVKAMHDELLQFQRNDAWTLVPRPEGEHIIGTKWIFCNKTDEEGNMGATTNAGKSKLHLDWPTRFSVCLGTTRGLAYLHEESRPRIVHRDVKASNILIDGKLCPKILDFGLAKLYDDTKTHINTRVTGTIGYLALEYAMRGHLTEKADVFSFGVVALEILSGRPNSDNSLDTEKIYLLEWAWTLHENNQSLRLLDPTLSKFDENEAARVIAMSLMCTQASPNMRPPMSRVVAMLTGDIEVGIVTSKLSYLTDWNFKDRTSSFLSEEDRKHHEDNTDLSQLGNPLPSPINVTETMFGGIIGDGR